MYNIEEHKTKTVFEIRVNGSSLRSLPYNSLAQALKDIESGIVGCNPLIDNVEIVKKDTTIFSIEYKSKIR